MPTVHPTDALGARRYEEGFQDDASGPCDPRRMGTAHRSGVRLKPIGIGVGIGIGIESNHELRARAT